MKHLWAVGAVLLWVSSAWADEVELVTGEKLKVSNVVREGGRVRMDHALLGRLDLDAASVRAVRADKDATADVGVKSDLADAMTSLRLSTGADAADAAPPADPKWKYRVELGVNGSTGNSDTQDIHAGASALLEEPLSRWKFDTQWIRSRAEHVTTKDAWYVAGLKDWMFKDSPWFAFATARYDHDKFQEWDSRLTVAAGPGYKFIDCPEKKLRGRLGIAATREWGGEDDRWRPEAMAGLDGNWQINEANSIEGAVTYYRDLRDTSEWRVLATLSWAIKLSQTEALSLKLGVEDEYDTHRDDPFEKNDFRYYAALLYEF